MEILPFLLAPFLASLILTGIHAYLGVHVVERGVIFVDLALAQIAALGQSVAFLLGAEPHDPSMYFWSFGFTLLGAAPPNTDSASDGLTSPIPAVMYAWCCSSAKATPPSADPM